MRKHPSADAATDAIGRILVAVRWVIIAGVLLETRVGFAGVRLEESGIFVSAAVAGVVTLSAQILRGRFQGRITPWATVIADTGFVTALVYFSGGVRSPFYPLYYLTVVFAAISAGVAGGLLCAAAAAALSAGVHAIQAGGRLAEAVLLEDVLRTFPYLFLIGLIGGVLRDRLKTADDTAARLRAETAVMDRELEVAAAVQRAQLPRALPRLDNLEITAFYRPASAVGGDLYDFYPVERDHLGITVADVAGKGVPAALLVSSAKYGISHNFSHDRPSMMRAVNSHLLDVTAEERFVTMVHGAFYPSAGAFHYVNAGHMPPIVVTSSGEVKTFPDADLPLGVLESAEYTDRAIELRPGDTLVLYTDGVTDAFGPAAEGLDAFIAFLADVSGSDPHEWGDELLRRVGEPRHSDDMTLVAIRLQPDATER